MRHLGVSQGGSKLTEQDYAGLKVYICYTGDSIVSEL